MLLISADGPVVGHATIDPVVDAFGCVRMGTIIRKVKIVGGNISQSEGFYSRLMSFLKKEGIKQVSFAEKTGFSAGQTNAIYHGRVKLGPRHAKVVAQAFSLSEEWLLTGEGEMRPKKAVGEETNDPELMTQVEAARRDRFGDIEPEPLVLTQTEASIIEYLRDLPDQTRLDACDHIRELWLRHRQRQNLSK